MTSIKFRALTHNDHKLFFEALGEHGKDFQNIQQYMAQKCAKGSRSSEQNKSIDLQERREHDKKEEDKKREQIRNFYNKLYGKLSQLLGKLDDRVEKVNQELYLLINYGEIWKKHGFKFNNKTKKLLEELVHQGYTTLRFKNKNVRLRTPPCKALKKINEIGVDEKVKVVTSRELPKDVIVEFHPATNRDWLKVQSMSQNPRVRAKLSIQKRLFNLLEFLENKWNVSHNKLNRTVDAWLKVPPSSQLHEDFQQRHCPSNHNAQNGTNSSGNLTTGLDTQNVPTDAIAPDPGRTSSFGDIHFRLRLKPSTKHELKEVNITRVVPDNHLDLSLNAYIRRLGENSSKHVDRESSKINTSKETSIHLNPVTNFQNDGIASSDNLDISTGTIASSSRVSNLLTPDSSILLERSCTSDQPSIAQARKHLNILQSLAGSFEGCESSRTTCEDTHDQFVLPQSECGQPSSFSGRVVSFVDADSNQPSSTVLLNNTIPALFDENAAVDVALPATQAKQEQASLNATSDKLISQNSDSQNSRSVDFNIPKNLTLGDWFKMAGQEATGEEANDSFSINQSTEICRMSEEAHVDQKIEREEANKATKVDFVQGGSMKPHNHMIEIKKLAEGWTRQDESSMTIGELYLAFKCPEKLVLEYEFEQFVFSNSTNPHDQVTSGQLMGKVDPPADRVTVIRENPSKNTLIFKLLTAASLSLAHIERQKLEQQHKLHDQPGTKMKRRKGPSNPNTIKYLKRDELQSSDLPIKQPEGNRLDSTAHRADNNNYISSINDRSQGQTMTLHDIEATNQRVEEALKQLQPTRLSVFRRAR